MQVFCEGRNGCKKRKKNEVFFCFLFFCFCHFHAPLCFSAVNLSVLLIPLLLTYFASGHPDSPGFCLSLVQSVIFYL